MSDYKLHCFAQSGNAYKAALMLELCGADWEPQFVEFFKGETRKPEYLTTNEMAEVPTLEHNGTKLTQSGVILDYLSAQFSAFGPRNAVEKREIMRWTLWDNHKLTSNIATVRFMMLFLPEDKRSPDVIAFLMGRAKAALAVLERRLSENHWVVGDQMTIADLSCIGYIYFLDEIGIDAETDYPNIARWRDEIAAQEGWKHPYDLMPGHPLT